MIGLIKGRFDPLVYQDILYFKELINKDKLKYLYIESISNSFRSNTIIKSMIKNNNKLKLYNNQYYDRLYNYNCITNIDYYIFDKLNKASIYYIYKYLFYLDEIVKDILSEYRYLHSLRVARLCQKLANYYNIDSNKAYVMGLLHDICKELDNQKELMLKYDLLNIDKPSALYHQYLGAIFVRKYFKIYDSKIIKAIKYHTTGEDLSLYGKILFISDKIESGRSYNTDKYYLLVYNNINGCYRLVLNDINARLE